MTAPYVYAGVVNVAAIIGAVYLIAHGHPWLGCLVLVIGSHTIDAEEKA